MVQSSYNCCHSNDIFLHMANVYVFSRSIANELLFRKCFGKNTKYNRNILKNQLVVLDKLVLFFRNYLNSVIRSHL